MRKYYNIAVPTYKRKNPKIFNMLKDENIKITLFVREEELQSGFYNDIKNDRVEIISIGTDVIDLGDTRQRILQYYIDNNIKYCIMFDDVIENIYDTSDQTKTISQCIEECVNRLENDELKDLCIFYQFHRENLKRCISDKNNKKYFICCPFQALIINTEIAKKYNIKYHTFSKIGAAEDEAIFADSLKAGLITCGNTKICIEGKMPCVKSDGGTHVNENDTEYKADYVQGLLDKYIGPMYGVYCTKKYRSNIKCMYAFANFDYDYFYSVLIEQRDKNKKIIDSKFKITYGE